MNCWIVSWFSLTFCTETSFIRCSCSLLISPISCKFRIWVFRRTFPFINNSSYGWMCRLDSTHPYCASCDANLCFSECRCSSPMHLLRDSTWSSCFARSDLACLEQVILVTFKKRSSQIRRVNVSEHRTPDQASLLRWKQCIGVPRSVLTCRWMRPQTFLSIGLSVFCTYLSLLHDHCIGFSRSFLGIQWWSQHLLQLSILKIRICNASHGIVEKHLRLEAGRLWYLEKNR